MKEDYYNDYEGQPYDEYPSPMKRTHFKTRYAERVYQTSEMPDHAPTTNKIWLGLLSGCLISIILVPSLIILVMNIADSIDALSQFWLGVVVLGIPLAYFGFVTLRKLLKP